MSDWADFNEFVAAPVPNTAPVQQPKIDDWDFGDFAAPKATTVDDFAEFVVPSTAQPVPVTLSSLSTSAELNLKNLAKADKQAEIDVSSTQLRQQVIQLEKDKIELGKSKIELEKRLKEIDSQRIELQQQVAKLNAAQQSQIQSFKDSGNQALTTVLEQNVVSVKIMQNEHAKILEEQKASHSLAMEQLKDHFIKSIQEVLQEERNKFKKILEEAIEEERTKSLGKLEELVQQNREQFKKQLEAELQVQREQEARSIEKAVVNAQEEGKKLLDKALNEEREKSKQLIEQQRQIEEAIRIERENAAKVRKEEIEKERETSIKYYESQTEVSKNILQEQTTRLLQEREQVEEKSKKFLEDQRLLIEKFSDESMKRVEEGIHSFKAVTEQEIKAEYERKEAERKKTFYSMQLLLGTLQGQLAHLSETPQIVPLKSVDL